MRRVEEFKISQHPYAVDLGSLDRRQTMVCVTAVWYRRKTGLLSAHIGYLRDYQALDSPSAEEFLARYRDGRYGGECLSRWNGGDLWTCCRSWETAERHKVLLEAMLAGYPAAPEGYDGWWVFEPAEPARRGVSRG